MTQFIDDIIFNTKMATLDSEPNCEEETFLQRIGLDNVRRRVTWEILSIYVLQEVIANLDTDTMKTNLNGQLVQFFGKD